MSAILVDSSGQGPTLHESITSPGSFLKLIVLRSMVCGIHRRVHPDGYHLEALPVLMYV